VRSGSIPRHHPRPQARKASIGSKAGKAHPALSRTTERVGAIVLIRSSVRIHRCHMVPNRRNRQAEHTRRGTPGSGPANPRSGHPFNHGERGRRLDHASDRPSNVWPPKRSGSVSAA
jgi:hypothetical protein